MAHFKKIVKKKHEGKVVYGDKIVNGIVYLALSEIPYVELCSAASHKKTKKNSIGVFFEKDGVYIQVFVKIHYSQCVSDMAFKIQEAIRHNVETMIEYHVSGVNVIVKGVLFGDIKQEKQPDAFAEDKPSEAVVSDADSTEAKDASADVAQDKKNI